jgi:hypothetical protein
LDGNVFLVTAPVWLWRPEPAAKASWHFLTIDPQTAAEMRYAALGRIGGFGSIRVTALIGGTRWQTSVFPHRDSGGFILPVKAEVRKREEIAADDVVTVRLEV